MRKSVTWMAASAAVLAGALALGSIGSAQEDKQAIIKQRQDFMKAQGADVKAIGDFAKGEGDATQAKAEQAANDLVTRSAKIKDMFPPGTSAAEFPGKTAAKPELWTDWDKVKVIPDKLKEEELKLVDVVKTGDKQAISAQLGSVGKNGCGACHGNYRLKQS